MSWKDRLASLKKYVETNPEYEDEGYDEELDYDHTSADEPANTASSFRPARNGGYNMPAQRPVAMKVVVIEPKVFEDSENIANQLRDMRPVVINFENTDAHEAARIVDFVSGATFALDGKLEKIGKDIFICVPNNITVDYNDKTYSDLSEKFAWKEPQL